MVGLPWELKSAFLQGELSSASEIAPPAMCTNHYDGSGQTVHILGARILRQAIKKIEYFLSVAQNGFGWWPLS